MIARHEGAAEAMSRAVRPWDSLDASKSPAVPIHTADPKEVMDTCLNCKRPYCTGDCENRASASRSRARPRGTVSLDRLRELRAQGMTIRQIAEELEISVTSVKYLVRKYRFPGPPKKYSAVRMAKPSVDPCLNCRTAYLCKTRGWTCADRQRWEEK